MTEAYENRIINGLLKADIGILSPEDVQARLSADVLVVCPPERSSRRDLWPCIWLLASVLQRQFTGRVLLDVGLSDELPAPIPLVYPSGGIDPWRDPECQIVRIGICRVGAGDSEQFPEAAVFGTGELAHPQTGECSRPVLQGDAVGD